MQKNAPRQRRWAPKVRTGCKTCKIRKKKCDEAKPDCLRCIKDKFKCDGYSRPKAWIFDPSGKSDPDSTPPVSNALSPVHLNQMKTHDPDDFAEADVKLRQASSHTLTNDLERSLSLLEPSTAWTAETDRNFCQFFLFQFAPLLSTTSQWQYFWRSVVPQAAWDHPAINHAMIAIAATYESRKSHMDRASLILSRSNLAIRAFRAQPSSLDITLIICRLFAALAQIKGDFQTATMHMNSGQRIFQEAARSGKTISDIIRTMAPTLLALSTETIDDAAFFMRTPPEKWGSFDLLKTLRSQYGRLLYSMSMNQWSKIDSGMTGLLSIAWSTLTQALSSAIYPDIVMFTAKDPITPVAEIILDLHAAGELMSLEYLSIEFTTLIQDLQEFVGTLEKRVPFPEELKARLKRCVENYLVQAAEIEPRMTAGTFWHDYDDPHCYIEGHFKEILVSNERSERNELLHFKSYADAPVSERAKKTLDPDFERKKRDYYLEHVCHYRSGFMPPPF